VSAYKRPSHHRDPKNDAPTHKQIPFFVSQKNGSKPQTHMNFKNIHQELKP
jgi:hypothetical protein